MAYSLHEMFAPQNVTGVVSREAAATSPILNFFGFAPVKISANGTVSDPAGGRQRRVPLRQNQYDVFNDTRTVAPTVPPGARAVTSTRQKKGVVTYVLPHMYFKRPFLSEELSNLRMTGGQSTEFGQAAIADELRRQARHMGQQAANWRLILTAGMMRGKLYPHTSGEWTYYDFTSSGASYDPIDWRTPSGNLNQLDMLGTGALISGTWATTTNNIPLMLANIDSSQQQLTGLNVRYAMTSSAVWQYVISNDYVQEQAGTANRPFEVFQRETGNGLNGLPTSVQAGRLACRPFLDWIITDTTIDLGVPGSTTSTRFVGVNDVYFSPEPSADLYEMLVGKSPVVDRPGGQEKEVYGLYSWTMTHSDPAGREIYCIDNALPANYVPAAQAYATVVGF